METKRRIRIDGLDSIRFVCATSVVFSHLGPPDVFWFISPETGTGRLLHAVYTAVFPGAPAVIAFFLVSGLCIHFPYVNGRTINVPAFYSQRLLRISLPLIAAVSLLPLCGMQFSQLNSAILWSLYCELVYYVLYPLLNRFFSSGNRRLRVLVACFGAFLPAFGVIAYFPEQLNYHGLGVLTTAMLGFPCWMLGVVLAEFGAGATPSKVEIWGLRLGVLVFATMATVLRFHAEVGFPFTLTLFSIYLYLWLRKEMAWRQVHAAPSWLETAGKWSYSLYLFHFPAHSLILALLSRNGLEEPNSTLLLTAVFFLAYVFYRLVELPSHWLAVKCKELVVSRSSIECAT